MRNIRPHIGVFGCTNVGKSSFVNCLSNQDVSITSDLPGTTTDPVIKTIELANAGPVVLIGTAGIDDQGVLGEKRIKRSEQVINRVDLGVILIANNQFGQEELQLIKSFQERETPFLLLHNKEDDVRATEALKDRVFKEANIQLIPFSSRQDSVQCIVEEVIETIREALPKGSLGYSTILGDLVKSKDIVLLVMPIDVEAPQGRMILPQMMATRDCLDHHCIVITLKETELSTFFKKTSFLPDLVITDSQVFQQVDKMIPKTIPLTSFSILFARFKGHFEKYVEGTKAISKLRNHDRVLILESCSHHVIDDDIGRVKIPKWLKDFTKKELSFDIIAGLDEVKRPVTDYQLVIQCGGCMLTRKQILNKLRPFVLNNIPVSNYGMTIAYVFGIFKRAIAPIVNSKK